MLEHLDTPCILPLSKSYITVVHPASPNNWWFFFLEEMRPQYQAELQTTNQA
jgi:hypothetical protein